MYRTVKGPTFCLQLADAVPTYSKPPKHIVGRVLSFFSSLRNWDSPNPSPAGVCAPPPFLGGGARSLAREGLGESQFRRGDIHFSTLYIYVLCAPKHPNRGEVRHLEPFFRVTIQQVFFTPRPDLLWTSNPRLATRKEMRQYLVINEEAFAPAPWQISLFFLTVSRWTLA